MAMKCFRCSARNSPAALECHHCGAEFEAVSTVSEIRPRRRWIAWLLTSLVVLLLMAAMDRLGLMAGRMVQNNSTPIASDENEVLKRYAAWKAAHGQSTATMMSFYAGYARIQQWAGSSGLSPTLAEFRQLCDAVRQQKSFDSVTDLVPPQIQKEGARIIITAQHRYGHSGLGNACDGDRRLVWKNRDGQWLIVEDDFPHFYTPVP